MVPYKFYILFKKKNKFKITSWSASLDLLLTSLWHPKWGFTVVFLSLHPFPAISQQTASVPALSPGCPLARSSEPALPRRRRSRSRSTQHCSGHTLCSADGFPQPPCSSSANRCHFCLLRCWAGSCLCEKPGRAMLGKGQVIWGDRYRMQTSGVIDAVLSLSASNWKTTLFLAELSLGSFSVSL